MNTLVYRCLVKYQLTCYDCDIINVTPERIELQNEKGLCLKANCNNCNKPMFSQRIVGPIIDMGLIEI